MKLRELKQENVVPGLRLRSLKNPENLGTVTSIDWRDDGWCYIQWDHLDYETGTYHHLAENEVVEAA